MPVPQWVNGIVTTTAVNGQTASDGVVTPLSTVGFPATPQFTIRELQTGELLLVTAVGATWSISRGYGGTTPAPIVAGDNLEYSITREMLLAGFVSKLDEQSIVADTAAGVLTLSVPPGIASLCQGLRVVLRIAARNNGSGNTYLEMRCNGDVSTAKYFSTYAYWGAGSSAGNFSGLNHARVGWVGYTTSGGAFTHAAHHVFDFSGCFDNAIFTEYTNQHHMKDGAGSYYMMQTAGRWEDTAPITSLAFAIDVAAANGTWAGGTVAFAKGYLYGVP